MARRIGSGLAAVIVLAVACSIAIAAAAAPAARWHARRRPPAGCLVPGWGKPLDLIWRPNLLSAVGYQRGRTGNISFAVRTDHAFYSYRPEHQGWSASVLKAMLMVAYLDRPSVANRPLDSYDTSLLVPMIEVSDNYPANVLDVLIGDGGLDALAARVGMTHFVPTQPIWGESLITADDQTRFFLHIDSYVVARHRAFAMHLLAGIVPSERWGIGEVAPPGWSLYFKGGWGAGTGLIDNQVALLTRGCARVSIAVLTMYDGSHAYGKETLKVIFQKLLKGLPLAHHRRYA